MTGKSSGVSWIIISELHSSLKLYPARSVQKHTKRRPTEAIESKIESASLLDSVA